MPRSTTRRLLLALFAATTVLSAACTRSDATGPSESPRANLSETQGADN
jgi:hypothetical protein